MTSKAIKAREKELKEKGFVKIEIFGKIQTGIFSLLFLMMGYVAYLDFLAIKDTPKEPIRILVFCSTGLLLCVFILVSGLYLKYFFVPWFSFRRQMKKWFKSRGVKEFITLRPLEYGFNPYLYYKSGFPNLKSFLRVLKRAEVQFICVPLSAETWNTVVKDEIYFLDDVSKGELNSFGDKQQKQKAEHLEKINAIGKEITALRNLFKNPD